VKVAKVPEAPLQVAAGYPSHEFKTF